MTVSSRVQSKADLLITLIDEELKRQVNEILHHPRLQALEASWRGLALLAGYTGCGNNVKIRILDVNWAQLARDTERASDFDQSQLFHLVYNQEFGMPGGEPFGLLVGDYMLAPGMKDGHDVAFTLSQISMSAAAAFCPFIAGADPKMLDLEDFAELNRIQIFSRSAQTTQSLLYRKWEKVRQREDSRFLGLVAPRILMRMPYDPDIRERNDLFPFREDVDEAGKALLWGNGAFAFAMVVIRNFIEQGWFADMRGVSQDKTDGGFLDAHELPPYDFAHKSRRGFESCGLSAQPPVEVRLTTQQEQQFCDMGLIPVATTYMSAAITFNANPSLHAPPHYTNENDRQNAHMSAMLQYILCVSRFSHYLKLIMREEVGQTTDFNMVRRTLAIWLSGYTLGNDDADLSLRARYPLRSASISVHEVPGCPGAFTCIVQLQPHFQLDGLSVTFQIVADKAVAPHITARNNNQNGELTHG